MDRFVARLTERLDEMVIGDPLDEATQGRIEPALVESGCLPWLSFREGEREKVPPYCMA